MESTNEVALGITSDAVAKDEIVHASTDINGIDLNETEVSERSLQGRQWLIEQQRAPVETAGVERRKAERGGHGGKG